MRNLKVILISMLTIVFFTSCANTNSDDNKKNNSFATVVDSEQRELVFDAKPENVVAIGSSLTDLWITAGGQVVGTSSDSFNKNLGFDEKAVINLGSYKEPNVEEVLKLNPDLVILSPKIAGQKDLGNVLERSGINTYYADINSFDDYLFVLKSFCDLTEDEKAYKDYGENVKTQIDEYKEKASEMDNRNALFLRTSSSYISALDSDNFAVKIIEDMGIDDIADSSESILNDLSIEEILKEDPYYIFLVVMGSNEEDSMAKLDEYIAQNPAWNSLTAVKEGRFIVLPKDLFHNKPNSRWGEAYEYIYTIRTENE